MWAWVIAWPRCQVVPLVLRVVPLSAGGQVVGAGGGPQTLVKSSVQALSQGHAVGRCRVTRRAEDALRAGTAISFRRIVAVVAGSR